MSTHQPNMTVPAGSQPTVSAERAFLSDVRLVLAVLSWARYPILNRVFGIKRDQVNILTFILAVSAVDSTYRIVRRIVHLRWPFDRPDTLIGAVVVREAGFSLAGPKARETELFGTLIAVAAIGSLVYPRMRCALHGLHVTEQRVGEQRMRFYGAAQRAASSPR